MQVPQHVARRCLFEAYAEGDLEQVHQAGGVQQHQQLLVSQPMLEMAAAVLATARTAEWQEVEQQHQTITCGTEVIALALPPDVETTQDYVNWLAYDPATGQSRPYEAYLLLSAAVKYGLIKGPILRGSEEVDFIAFGPAFKGMVGGNSQELREHLQAATDAKHFDVMPQQFVANAIKVELKVPIGGDWEGVFAQCKKELDREPELNILLACNFVNCASLADFAEEHRTRLIPWYDDVLDKVAWDASGFWSYDADFHGSPVSADLQYATHVFPNRQWARWDRVAFSPQSFGLQTRLCNQ